MKNTLAAIAALAALTTASAFAADMPLKAPPPAPAPVWSWTGFYVGINGGGAWSNQTWFVPGTALDIADGCGPAFVVCNLSAGSDSSFGWVFGGQVGFNYQLNQWVFGVEAQADWTKLSGANAIPAVPTVTVNDKMDSLGTIAARLGITWNRTLLYAKGGAAWTHDRDFSTDPSVCGASVCQNLTYTRWGWAAGVGVEQALTQNWSVKLEYDHLDFGNVLETLQPVCGVCTAPFQYNVRHTIDVVEAGLNYRFNWLGGP